MTDKEAFQAAYKRIENPRDFISMHVMEDSDGHYCSDPLKAVRFCVYGSLLWVMASRGHVGHETKCRRESKASLAAHNLNVNLLWPTHDQALKVLQACIDAEAEAA